MVDIHIDFPTFLLSFAVSGLIAAAFTWYFLSLRRDVLWRIENLSKFVHNENHSQRNDINSALSGYRAEIRENMLALKAEVKEMIPKLTPVPAEFLEEPYERNGKTLEERMVEYNLRMDMDF